MIQFLNKSISVLAKFSTYSPTPVQPRIIKAKKLPQLQTQSVNLNMILQNLMLPPFKINKDVSKDNWQFQQANYFLNQIQNDMNSSSNLSQTKLIKFQQFKTIQYLFQILSKRTKFDKSQEEFLYNLVTILLKLYTFSKTKELNLHRFKQNFQLFNKYLMLVPLNLKLIILFIKFSNKYQKQIKKLNTTSVKFVNDKLVFDYILSSKHNYNFNFIKLALSYCAFHSLQSRYFEKNQQIMNFLIKRIPKDWVLKIKQQQTSQKVNSLASFLISYMNINFFDQNIIEGVKYIIKQNFKKFNIKQICLGIKILLQLRQIKSENIKQFMPLIEQLIQTQPTTFFRYCTTQLYRAGIWENKIWLNFFDWLKQEQNREVISKYFLYSIYYLMNLDKDLISKQIIQEQIKTRDYLLKKHNFIYDHIDSLKQFYKIAGQQFKTNMTVQQSFTNNMRLISQLQIKSQVQISVFFVDIVIGDKTVIQINNRDHYIHNIDKKTYFYNLKSEFRKRVLQKLGYKYLDIDVFQIRQGSFELLKNLYNNGILSNKPQ